MATSKNLSNINIGASPNSGDGDLLRDAFIKVNSNFNDLCSYQICKSNSRKWFIK